MSEDRRAANDPFERRGAKRDAIRGGVFQWRSNDLLGNREVEELSLKELANSVEAYARRIRHFSQRRLDAEILIPPLNVGGKKKWFMIALLAEKLARGAREKRRGRGNQG